MKDSSGLSMILSSFDYRKEATLPGRLLTTLQEDSQRSICVDGRDSLSMRPLFFGDQALRYKLVISGKATDQTMIPTLYVYGQSRRLYYDPQTGERLGDELGIDDWLRQ